MECLCQLLLLGDVEEEAVEVGGPAGLVTDDRLVKEPMHRPIPRDHAVLRPERLVGVARAAVFGQDPLAVLWVEDLRVQLLVGDPFLHGVAELGLQSWAGVDVGASLVQPVDVDGDRDVLDQRPERHLVQDLGSSPVGLIGATVVRHPGPSCRFATKARQGRNHHEAGQILPTPTCRHARKLMDDADNGPCLSTVASRGILSGLGRKCPEALLDRCADFSLVSRTA